MAGYLEGGDHDGHSGSREDLDMLIVSKVICIKGIVDTNNVQYLISYWKYHKSVPKKKIEMG